jgi:hypothetical protein
MCAERGNFWAIREVGLKKYFQSSEIEISDDKIGMIKFPVPPSDDLVSGKSTPLGHLPLNINGKIYWYKASNGNKHTYFRPAMHNNGVDESLTLEFTLKANGVVLK